MTASVLGPAWSFVMLTAACCLTAIGGAATATTQTAEQCAAEWARARADYSVPQIEAFIREFPGCAEVEEARSILNVATSPTLGGRPDRYTAVGRILPRKAPMSPEGGGYGVVLLRRTTDRNPQACEVMRRSLAFEIAEVDRRAELIDGFNVYRRPIYWPTTLDADGRREWDCKAMLSSYDYDRAWLRFSDLPRLSRPGPYIVIVRDTGSHAAIFDFSGIPVDEFDEQFEIVLRYMSRDASIWRGTYYRGASFRQRMRRLLSEDSAATTLVIASLIGLPQPARAATTNE